MSLILIIAFLFAVGSFIGWGLEVIFRRFFSSSNKERKWINPGFLVGPYLPLYGCSLIILFLLAQIERYVPIENDIARKLVLFIIMALAITVVEYFTGLIFIVKMKIKLWDYSDNFGNVKGIICPRYTFFWMLLSAVYYFLINPHILNSLKWLSENLSFSFFIGFFYGVFAIDLVTSLKQMLKIHKFAKENEIVIFIEDLKKQIMSYKEQKKESAKFLLALHSSDNLQNQLKRYKERYANLKANISENLEEFKEKHKPVK